MHPSLAPPIRRFVTMIRSPVKCLRSFVATFGQCDVVAAANFNFTRFAKRAFMARDKLPTTVQRSRNPNAQALGFYDWAFSLAGHGAIGLQLCLQRIASEVAGKAAGHVQPRMRCWYLCFAALGML